MPKRSTITKNNGLGRTLIKHQRNQNKVKAETSDAFKHTIDELNKESILDQSDVKEIMDYANTVGKEFSAVKPQAVVIKSDAFNVEIIDPNMIENMERHWNDLKIPKRPPWTEDLTKDQLEYQERESFAVWRRELADLEENKKLLITPFEKNIEVWRQLWRVVERSSLVVQIVDARNPLMFRCVDLEKWVDSFGNKRNLLVVNKADFLTEKQREMWVEYFKKEKVNFVFFSAKESEENLESETNQQLQNMTKDDYATSKLYNPETLINKFYQECLKIPLEGNERRTEKFVIGMVGYPNVGKSSTINVLLGQKKVAVSRTPGKTKHFQTLHLPNKPIILCDCPGLVFPSFMTTRSEMVCNGLIRIAELREIVGPVRIVCKYFDRKFFEELYNMKVSGKENTPLTAEDLLTSLAFARGFIGARGQADNFRAGKMLLSDFVDGKILYCNPPPNVKVEDFQSDRIQTKDDSLKIIEEKPEEENNDEITNEIEKENDEKANEGKSIETEETNKDSNESEDDEEDNEEDDMQDLESELGELNIEDPGAINDINPNDRRLAERGRKFQRRKREKIKMELADAGIVKGKKGRKLLNNQAYQTPPTGIRKLPTNIKLTKKTDEDDLN